MISQKTSTIGVVELPSLGLFDAKKKNHFSHVNKTFPLVGKQILLSNFQAAGFDAKLINLKPGDYEEEFGKITWRGTEYSKVYYGGRIKDIDPLAYDAWGVTNNFFQYREIAEMTIKHLASKGKPVVVGGSDAIAGPQFYFAAGATAVVLDKTGGANASIMDYVLEKKPREELSGVILANGNQPPRRVRRPLHPEEWPIPDVSVIQQCFGTNSDQPQLNVPEELLSVGSIIPDIGCDRQCDFCQTPTYRLGYQAMSPKRVLQWLVAQKEAGARSVSFYSDQFLGRILKKGGRDDVLEIMKGMRELELAVLWLNGLELKKVTMGRGINRKNNTDMTPDDELISALWGWNGKTGCYSAYIPAERPIFGQENYAKLLPWQKHCDIIKAIARTGIPVINYGVMIGFADDNDESLLRLEEAIARLYEDILTINPLVIFQVFSLTLIPIPGTPQWDIVGDSGLIRIKDPSILGAMGTTGIDTNYLSYEQVADWQERLAKIGSPYTGF
jgi:radical SAM superfamily enzyme YgiQ (UPF0313 family)